MKKSNQKSSRNTKAQKAAVARHRLDPQMKIVPLVDGNPRREKSLGHKSFSIITAARKPITVETFVQKGGRLRDLHWDVNAKNVKLVRKVG